MHLFSITSFCFEALARSERRQYFAWIESAKREETKLSRPKEAIQLLASGKVLGLKERADRVEGLG